MRANPGKVLGVIVAALAVLAALAGLSGGMWFAKHEADTLHLIDIVLRRAAGARPHLDYMTPLGILAFEPFAVLHRAGMELGSALVWGQVAVAALLAPGAVWIGARRLGTAGAIAFALMVVLLAAGMVFGGTDAKVSLSMHYNRWAWAVVFLPLLAVLLAPGREASVSEGVIIGVAMAALALLKATYFVAFAPAVIAGLMLRGMWRTLGVSVLVGLGVLGALTAVYGAEIWAAYVADLRAVAGSEVRGAPAGAQWAEVVLAPRHIVGTLVAVGSVLMLRSRARGEPVSLILGLMLPGAIYVTYQNYGNDPMWLLLWGLVLLSLPARARGWRQARGAGIVALALIAPVAVNIAASPLRHATQPAAVFAPLFPGQDGRSDIFAVQARMETVQGKVPLGDTEGTCELASGLVGWTRAQVDALTEAQLSGARIFVADLFNFLWLFGEFERLSGGAPWFYDGLPGFEEAELLVVPKCPVDAGVRTRVIEAINAGSVELIEDFSTDVMTVYEILR